MEINSTTYYNSIAKEYDALVGAEKTNTDARNFIRKKSTPFFIKDAHVLDFGGGTGLDIQWLSTLAAHLFFYEPALEMKKFAQERAHKNGLLNVTFLPEAFFTNWRPAVHELKEKQLEVIFSNFAVLNSIHNIEPLFARFAYLLKPDGVMLLTVLNNFPRKKHFGQRVTKILGYLKFLWAFGSFVIQGDKHSPVIHTHRKIKAAASPHFNFVSSVAVPGSTFTLYIFKRK